MRWPFSTRSGRSYRIAKVAVKLLAGSVPAAGAVTAAVSAVRKFVLYHTPLLTTLLGFVHGRGQVHSVLVQLVEAPRQDTGGYEVALNGALGVRPLVFTDENVL